MTGYCPTLQVAERSLFLWNNEYIVSLVAQHRHVVLPLVFPALERNARSHWNPAVHGLTVNVRKMFQEMDEGLYEDCRLHFEDDEARVPGTGHRIQHLLRDILALWRLHSDSNIYSGY